MTDFKIRDCVKVKIVQELIEPFYVDDIKSMIRGKKCWKLTGQLFETISKVLVALGSILSFSSGYFEDPLLSFLAGSISTLSLATLQFASFAFLENKRQGQDLNVLLKKLDLDVVPILEQHVSERVSAGGVGGGVTGSSIDGGEPREEVLSKTVKGKHKYIVIDDEVLVPRVKPVLNLSVDEGLVMSEFTPSLLQQQHVVIEKQEGEANLKEHSM